MSTRQSNTGSYITPIVVAVVVFLGIGVRLGSLQLKHGEEHLAKTDAQIRRDTPLPALRGLILNRDNVVFATNRPSYNVYITPKFVTDASLDQVGSVVGASPDFVTIVKTRVQNRKGADRLKPMPAFEDIPIAQVAILQGDNEKYPGVTIVVGSKRQYPLETSLAHAVGFMNMMTAAELEAKKADGYSANDLIGRGGLEKQWEGALRGQNGFERVIVDARGRAQNIDPAMLTRQADKPYRVEPVAGNNVILNIDYQLQAAAEKALSSRHSGAVVVIEVKTGRVLALASGPSYDNNAVGKQYATLIADPLRPLINKAVGENFFPGSTYKPIPALAALEDHAVAPDEEIYCVDHYAVSRHVFHCHEMHEHVDMWGAIMKSCNVYFVQVGEKLGLNRMAGLANDFGLGSITGIGLPEEVPGFQPTVESYNRQRGGYSVGQAMNVSIGQGEVKVTPLQLAVMYAAIANGGDVFVPHLVDRIVTPATGVAVQEFLPQIRQHLAFKTYNLNRVKEALCTVVSDPKGTAFSRANRDVDVRVCGKTGTSQVKKNIKVDPKDKSDDWDVKRDHAWFASWAPAADPEIAVVVFVEHGGFGSKAAVPVAMDIYRARYGVKATLPAEPPGAADTDDAPDDADSDVDEQEEERDTDSSASPLPTLPAEVPANE